MMGLVQVQLDLSNPQSHLVHVRLEISSPQAQQEVTLPGWTPGSYLIRDYVRQLEGFKAVQQGLERSVRRTDPSTWQIETCYPIYDLSKPICNLRAPLHHFFEYPYFRSKPPKRNVRKWRRCLGRPTGI